MSQQGSKVNIGELKAAIADISNDTPVVMQVRLMGVSYPINEYYEIEETDFDVLEGTIFLMSPEEDI